MTEHDRSGGVLHVVNGDAVAAELSLTSLRGELLPWRDVLHEGPVPLLPSRQELTALRARFIAEQGWGAAGEVHRDLARRDAVLARAGEYDEVVLWFEHDLYDQLQLIQVLDVLAREALDPGRLRLISIDRYPGVEPFHGLGQLGPEDLMSLFDARRLVTDEQLVLAVSAWRAFRDADPEVLPWWLTRDTTSLPFLGAALGRHVEQLPSARNGLGRTEKQILEGVASGLGTPLELFRYDLEREESPFLGDLPFWTYLKRLAAGDRPLIRIESAHGKVDTAATAFSRSVFAETRVMLSDDGRLVLAGDADQIDWNGIERWFGGVHLKGRKVWRRSEK